MTGKTPDGRRQTRSDPLPQWSPVVMTGKTRFIAALGGVPYVAPQWSPVVMTGKTCSAPPQTADTAACRNGAPS